MNGRKLSFTEGRKPGFAFSSPIPAEFQHSSPLPTKAAAEVVGALAGGLLAAITPYLTPYVYQPV